MQQVLKDPGRRRQYDAARQAASSGPSPGGVGGFGSGGGFGGGGGDGSGGGGSGGFSGYQPGVDNDAFEESFRKWWEKAGGKCGSLLPMCPPSPPMLAGSIIWNWAVRHAARMCAHCFCAQLSQQHVIITLPTV